MTFPKTGGNSWKCTPNQRRIYGQKDPEKLLIISTRIFLSLVALESAKHCFARSLCVIGQATAYSMKRKIQKYDLTLLSSLNLGDWTLLQSLTFESYWITQNFQQIWLMWYGTTFLKTKAEYFLFSMELMNTLKRKRYKKMTLFIKTLWKRKCLYMHCTQRLWRENFLVEPLFWLFQRLQDLLLNHA